MHKIELETSRLDREEPLAISIDGKTYRIQITKTESEKTIPVKVEDVVFRTEVKTPIHKEVLTTFQPTPNASTRKTTAAARQTMSEGAVTAPMTGKIVRVQVKKGDVVKQSQVLCVIEAMKMENEITAPRAGTVEMINVSAGSPVNESDVLFVIN